MNRRPTLTIRTPEGIAFAIETASPVARFLALVIDQICVYALSTVLTMVCSAVGFINSDVAGALWMLSWFVLSIGYPIALEWGMRGQTIGKRAMRLRVMDVQALRLTFSQVVVRNLLRFVDVLLAFYMVGGMASLVSPRGQRIGDLAANTVVVYHPLVSEPDLTPVLPGKFNSFRQYPHLAARLRQQITPREAGLMLRALMRRDTMDDAARVSLFEEMRDRVAGLVEFPIESTEGLSAEQYVRNVADILFRPQA